MGKKLNAQEEAKAIEAAVAADNPVLNETVQDAVDDIAEGGGPLVTEAAEEAAAGRPALQAALEKVRAKMGLVRQAHDDASAEADALMAAIMGGDYDDDKDDGLVIDSD